MYCDKCGYNNNNTAVHCLGCGAPLRSDVDKESSNKKKKSNPSGVSKIRLTISIVLIFMGLAQASFIFKTALAEYGWDGYKKVQATLERSELDPLEFKRNYTFSFWYMGKRYDYELVCDYFGNYHYYDGQILDLYFDPEYPDDIVEINEQAEMANLTIAGIGMVIFVIGCIVLIKPLEEIIFLLIQDHKKRRILTTGYGIRCIVKDVTHEYITGSDVVGSKIICTDVATGRIYESALIKQDLMWLSPGMEVGVMVDRTNPDNYWVLTPKPNTYMPYTQNGGFYN